VSTELQPFEIKRNAEKWHIVNNKRAWHFALLRTCKQIRQECGDLFYTCNCFILQAGNYIATDDGRSMNRAGAKAPAPLHEFLSVIGPKNHKFIQMLRFRLSPMDL